MLFALIFIDIGTEPNGTGLNFIIQGYDGSNAFYFSSFSLADAGLPQCTPLYSPLLSPSSLSATLSLFLLFFNRWGHRLRAVASKQRPGHLFLLHGPNYHLPKVSFVLIFYFSVFLFFCFSVLFIVFMLRFDDVT